MDGDCTDNKVLKAASEEGAVFCGVGLYEMHNRGWIYLLWGEY
jgi:hypothetical protein